MCIQFALKPSDIQLGIYLKVYLKECTVVTFFVAEIVHIYLFCDILFLLFSISMKIFEHELFSVYLMKRCARVHARKCTIRLTITSQDYIIFIIIW